MHAGKFTRIPERPDDLAELWRQALPLTPETLPLWASGGTADRYRYLGSVSAADLSAGDREILAGEIDLLENAGLAIDGGEHDPLTHRIYVPGPTETEVWSIGVFTGDSPLRLASPGGIRNPVLTSRDITDVPAAFVADPFMLERDGTWFMFFEIMNWQLGRGQIGLAESANGVDWTYRGVALAAPFHLSYPYVFEWDGRCYMIPETHQTGAVRLYEAASFPLRWSHVATLIEGPFLADASVVRHRDTWWLFVDSSPGRKSNTLSLYHADKLAGPWAEHPRSPIVHRDSRTARPAGRVIALGDTLIRYAQNCVPSYGSEVLAFAVTELTRERYEERPAIAAPVLTGSGAGWNSCGMHHVDAHLLRDGRWFACVDGWTRERSWAGVGDARADVALGLMGRDIERVVPPGTLFVLVDKGRGIEMSGGRRSVPFPERDGEWAGYPADDSAAVAELERLRHAGAEFIVFPAPMFYWLDAYPGLQRHLAETARRVLHNDRVCIYHLRRS